MARRSKKLAPEPDTISLLPGDIIRDPNFNARKDYEASEPAETPGDRLSDEQLEASIARQGVLSPPRIQIFSLADPPPTGHLAASVLAARKSEGDTTAIVYSAVFGYRRLSAAEKVAPTKPVLCSIHRGTFYDAKLANLSENLHRRDLKPWEIAEALYSIRQEDPDISNVELANRVGLKKSYVGNLLRIREKAHPDVWAQFRRWGMSLTIGYHQLLEIVMLPSERQLEAWNALVEAKKTTHPARGAEKKPGPVKLRKFYKSVDALTHHTSEFRRGLKYAFSIALGTRTWDELVTAKKARKGT